STPRPSRALLLITTAGVTASISCHAERGETVPRATPKASGEAPVQPHAGWFRLEAESHPPHGYSPATGNPLRPRPRQALRLGSGHGFPTGLQPLVDRVQATPWLVRPLRVSGRWCASWER